MRRSSSRALRARRFADTRTNTAGQWRQLWAWLRRLAHGAPHAIRWSAVTLVLLGSISFALAARVAGATADTQSAAAQRLRAIVADPPPIARFSDASDATAYRLWLQAQPDHQRGEFTFSLPNGDQIRGLVPLTLLKDGSFGQSQICDSAQLTSNLGLLYLAAPTASQLASGSTFTEPSVLRASSSTGFGGAELVYYTLRAHIAASGLVAYAALAFERPAQYNADQQLCPPTGATEPGAVLLAGCSVDTCTDPLATAVARVVQYDKALVAADWATVYASTSQTVRGQYSAAAFASVLTDQQQKAGKISAVSPPSSAPQVLFDSAGHGYFVTTQQVTVSQAGKTTTRDITSYYLLEGGQWMFWFSA